MPRPLLARCITFVGLALSRTSLGGRVEDEDPTDQTKPSHMGHCCCRGPLDLQCRRLPPSFERCPEDIGYKQYVEYRNHRKGSVPFPLLPPQACSHEPTTEDVRERSVTVKAYWMRHGWSCANALQEQMTRLKLGLLRHPQEASKQVFFQRYPDPPLTDVAKMRARELGKLVSSRMNVTPRLVFSSHMERAIETAELNFPDQDVYPIPYIAEKGTTKDNTPSDCGGEDMPQQPGKRKFDDAVNPYKHPDRCSEQKSDYLAFKRYLPVVLSKLLGEVKDGEEIPIVIVGHSTYMKQDLKACKGGHNKDGKPKNNEVWVQTYHVNLGAYDAELEAGECKVLFDLENGHNIFPDPPSILCPEDVKSCEFMQPTIWMNQTERDKPSVCNKNPTERDKAANETYTSILLHS